MSKDFSTRLLRLNDVIAAIGMKRSWIYQKTRDGEFPKPIKLSERAVAWYASDIEDWIKSRAVMR